MIWLQSNLSRYVAVAVGSAMIGFLVAWPVFATGQAIGLGGVFLHLRAELNFYRLFNEAIENFSLPEVAVRQAAALDRAGLPHPEG